MRRLFLAALLAFFAVLASAQTTNQARVVYKPVATNVIRFTNSTTDGWNIDTTTHLNDQILDMYIELAALGKTDAAVSAILNKTIGELYDRNGVKVWP